MAVPQSYPYFSEMPRTSTSDLQSQIMPINEIIIYGIISSLVQQFGDSKEFTLNEKLIMTSFERELWQLCSKGQVRQLASRASHQYKLLFRSKPIS